MFYVYILKCNDDSLYIGHTDDLEKRFHEHTAMTFPCSYTSTRLSLTLVYADSFGTRDEAKAAEHKLKRWTRKKKDALIESNWERLAQLSKKLFG